MLIKKYSSFLNKCLDNKKLRMFLFILSSFLIFGVVLFLNIKTPLLGDDYTYRLIFDTSEKIQSFQDIVKSQQIHYEKWGGRVVVHSIAQLLLQLPTSIIDVINSIAFLALVILIYVHINFKKPFSVSLLVGIFLLLWFLEPFAETILWITGSANYMWGTIIILAFLLPYRTYFNKQQNVLSSVISLIIMLLAGVIAGWTNENTGAGLIIMVVLFLLLFREKKWKIPLWAYTGLFGVLAGYAVMLMAPGNAARSTDVQMGVFTVVYNLFRHTQSLLNELGLFNLVFVILFIIVYKQKRKDFKFVLLESLIFGVGALASVYVMIFSPAFPERAWFGAIVYNIIALGLLVVNVNHPIIRYIKYGFIGLGILIFVFNSYDVVKDVLYVDRILKDRETFILKSKEEGKQIIYIEKYEVRTKYAMPDPIYSEPLMPRYYGVEVKYKK